MHCSLRSTNIDLPTIVNESLSGLDGYGGGHLHACGVSVRKEDFDIFLERLKKSI
jgi:nanoRNase/pAp phosphatase (c-di-AMP/oligoRNAs hydrolase)